MKFRRACSRKAKNKSARTFRWRSYLQKRRAGFRRSFFATGRGDTHVPMFMYSSNASDIRLSRTFECRECHGTVLLPNLGCAHTYPNRRPRRRYNFFWTIGNAGAVLVTLTFFSPTRSASDFRLSEVLRFVFIPCFASSLFITSRLCTQTLEHCGRGSRSRPSSRSSAESVIARALPCN